MTDNKRDWTTTEMAAHTGFNQSYFRRQILEGKLKGTKRGSIWFVANEDFQAWLAEREKRLKP